MAFCRYRNRVRGEDAPRRHAWRAYARPRYAICANVLIAALSGEHKRQEERRRGIHRVVPRRIASRRESPAIVPPVSRAPSARTRVRVGHARSTASARRPRRFCVPRGQTPGGDDAASSYGRYRAFLTGDIYSLSLFLSYDSYHSRSLHTFFIRNNTRLCVSARQR